MLRVKHKYNLEKWYLSHKDTSGDNQCDKKFKFLFCQSWLYFVLAGSECSDETVWMHRLFCVFAIGILQKSKELTQTTPDLATLCVIMHMKGNKVTV